MGHSLFLTVQALPDLRFISTLLFFGKFKADQYEDRVRISVLSKVRKRLQYSFLYHMQKSFPVNKC